jgi:hypothetical protein
MRFHAALFALTSTIALVSALNLFTVPEIDLTSAGMLSRPEVPAPQAPARFRQATRASIIARQKRGPARRQISTSPICNRPITGTTNYAVFTNAFFFTDVPLVQGFAATVEECYAYCEATSGKTHTTLMYEGVAADFGRLCSCHSRRHSWRRSRCMYTPQRNHGNE